MNAVTIHDTVIRNGSRFLGFDLRDILNLARDRAIESTWVCTHVDCVGPTSDDVHAASESGAEICGSRLFQLAEGIRQTIDGTFSAYLFSDKPWCVIRAIDSTLFVVITADEAFLSQIRQRFADVRDSPEDNSYTT